MLNYIRSLMTEQVQHGDRVARDLFGQVKDARGTLHAARVIEVHGSLQAPASGERTADASATIWLLNHPRLISAGDTFTLPSGRTLAVRRVEYRTDGQDTLAKVHLT
jgi:hypothetical protein